MCRDRKRNDEGVACYVTSDISYIQKQYFPEEIENIFFEILLPKTKPIVVGIIYRSSSQIIFVETITFLLLIQMRRRYTFLVILT